MPCGNSNIILNTSNVDVQLLKPDQFTTMILGLKERHFTGSGLRAVWLVFSLLFLFGVQLGNLQRASIAVCILRWDPRGSILLFFSRSCA